MGDFRKLCPVTVQKHTLDCETPIRIGQPGSIRAVILPGFLSNQAEIWTFGAQKMSNVHMVRQKTWPGFLPLAGAVFCTLLPQESSGRTRGGISSCGCRQCWTASGVKLLQSPSHIKMIKLRNLFKAANGGMMTTDFLICDDFIENVDSGLYELKLFSLIYF